MVAPPCLFCQGRSVTPTSHQQHTPGCQGVVKPSLYAAGPAGFALDGCAPSCYRPRWPRPPPPAAPGPREQEAVGMDPVTIFGIVQTLRRASKVKGVVGMFGLKNLLALVGLVVVAFVGVGWYLGWYNFTATDDANGQHHLKIQVNASQITDDLSKGKQKVIMILDKEK